MGEQRGGAAERAALRRIESELASGAADTEDAAEQFSGFERGIGVGQRIAFGDEYRAAIADEFTDHAVGEEAALAGKEHHFATMDAHSVFAANGNRVTGAQPGPHAATEDAERDRAAGTKDVGEHLGAEADVVGNELGGSGAGDGRHA